VCCSVLQDAEARRGAPPPRGIECWFLRCSVLQRVAVCCSVLQYVAMCYSVLQCEKAVSAPPPRGIAC